MKVWLNDNFEKIVKGVPRTAEEKKDHVKIQVKEICFYLCKFPWIKGDDMSINIFVKYLMINFNYIFLIFILNHQILTKMVINLGHCIGSNVLLNDHSLFNLIRIWFGSIFVWLHFLREGGADFVDKVIIKPSIKTKIKSKVYV